MAGLPTTASVVPRSSWYDFHIMWDASGEPEGTPSTRPEVRLAYHRPVMLPYTQRYAARLMGPIGVTPDSRVLVVGGGFGFLAETLLSQPYGLASERVASQDAAVYIGGAYDETEEADINALIVGVGVDLGGEYGKELKGRLFDGGARCRVRFTASMLESQSAANAVRSLFPSSSISHVITDDGYLCYHSDEEIADIFTAVDRLGAAETWHIVYTDWGNGKPLADWKALKPTHRFIDYVTAQTA